jgi:hypothetical protein
LLACSRAGTLEFADVSEEQIGIKILRGLHNFRRNVAQGLGFD